MSNKGRPAEFDPRPFVTLLTPTQWEGILALLERLPRLKRSDVVRGLIDDALPRALKNPTRILRVLSKPAA